MKQRFSDKVYELKSKVGLGKTPKRSVVEPQLGYVITLITNIRECFSKADLDMKTDILSSILDGKMIFCDGKCRTVNFNPIMSLMTGKSIICEDEKENGVSDFSETPLQYPEPHLKLLNWIKPY